MPAWLWITAPAAVAFVFWIGWGRGWLRAWRYDWQRAQHVRERAREEVEAASVFYGSMSYDAELGYWAQSECLPAPTVEQNLRSQGATGWLPAPPVDPAPWLEQTMAELSPEALDDLPPLPPDLSGDLDAIPPNRIDPGPGDAAVEFPPASSGPDQPSRWLAEQLDILRTWSEWQQQKAGIFA